MWKVQFRLAQTVDHGESLDSKRGRVLSYEGQGFTHRGLAWHTEPRLFYRAINRGARLCWDQDPETDIRIIQINKNINMFFCPNMIGHPFLQHK